MNQSRRWLSYQLSLIFLITFGCLSVAGDHHGQDDAKGIEGTALLTGSETTGEPVKVEKRG